MELTLNVSPDEARALAKLIMRYGSEFILNGEALWAGLTTLATVTMNDGKESKLTIVIKYDT